MKMTKPPVVQNPDSAWEAYHASLQKSKNWTLRARLGIRYQDQAESADLLWEQRADRYDMTLSGPLGLGTIILKGTPMGVVLTDAKGIQHMAVSPEGILASLYGWHLPVAGMRYWVLGIPEPGSVSSQTLNTFGTLARLSQSGWRVTYANYHLAKPGLPVPTKLIAVHQNPDIRLVMKVYAFDFKK